MSKAKQIPAMQPETRAPSVPLRLSWCPCLISPSAFLGSTPARLPSPSIPSTLPVTVTSAVCPVEEKTVLHLSAASHTEDHALFLEPLASRTLGSPGFPAASLGLPSQAFLMAPEVLALLTYWILTSTWWNSAGLGSQVSLYVYIFPPLVSILPSGGWSPVSFPSPDSFPECPTWIYYHQHLPMNATHY